MIGPRPLPEKVESRMPTLLEFQRAVAYEEQAGISEQIIRQEELEFDSKPCGRHESATEFYSSFDIPPNHQRSSVLADNRDLGMVGDGRCSADVSHHISFVSPNFHTSPEAHDVPRGTCSTNPTVLLLPNRRFPIKAQPTVEGTCKTISGMSMSEFPPPLAKISPHIPTATFKPDSTVTCVPLARSSSILMHAGFEDLLSITGSRFVGTTTVFPNSWLEESCDQHYGNFTAFQRDVGKHHHSPTKMPYRNLYGVPAMKEKLSIGMVGRPGSFTHLCHASNMVEAEELLHRWHKDGQGKVAEPSWALQVKKIARASALGDTIRESDCNKEKSRSSLSNISSDVEVETGHSVRFLPSFEGQVKNGTPSTRQHNGAYASGTIVLRPDTSLLGRDSRHHLDKLPIGGYPSSLFPYNTNEFVRESDASSASSKTIAPSVVAIEKAVATKIFLETHYHAILKRPRGRDQRRAMIEAELSRLKATDEERRNIRDAWSLGETEYLRELRSRINIGSFTKIKIIGHGAFGVVSLVREQSTGELFAMKQLRKSDMLKKGQEGHVRAERDLLATASGCTRWTVPLAYSFQDVDHLYLVMSFMGGGDLLTLLIDRDMFSENFARFIFAEMVLAVEETHNVLGAIHRDIKPDNFLFDDLGHIAISDFGLATDFHWAHDGKYYDQQRRALLHKHGIDLEDGKVSPYSEPFDLDLRARNSITEEEPGSVLTQRDRNRRKLAYSVVGTNNYMAVEVLRGRGYDEGCDWWSLGVILYEMLYGFPPFVSKSRHQTRQKIINWKTSLKFPSRPRISRDAQDLISRLICEKEDRIGARPSTANLPDSISTEYSRRDPTHPDLAHSQSGADEIKNHSWFKGIDFTTIHLQTPPFVPELATPYDTRYFEENIDDNPLPGPDVVPGAAPIDNTRDVMLKHEVHGPHLLDMRKSLAFQGWTYKKPKREVFNPRNGIFNFGDLRSEKDSNAGRGRSNLRVSGGSVIRSLSV